MKRVLDVDVGFFFLLLFCILLWGKTCDQEQRIVSLQEQLRICISVDGEHYETFSYVHETIDSIEKTFGSLVKYLEAREMLIDWNKEAEWSPK